VIGVGDFAAKRAQEALAGSTIKTGQILHPSPACPASNKDWAGKVTKQLQELGVWT
jgi:single-strand selective monofunctional uracil DNA glycosylase